MITDQCVCQGHPTLVFLSLRVVRCTVRCLCWSWTVRPPWLCVVGGWRGAGSDHQVPDWCVVGVHMTYFSVWAYWYNLRARRSLWLTIVLLNRSVWAPLSFHSGGGRDPNAIEIWSWGEMFSHCVFLSCLRVQLRLVIKGDMMLAGVWGHNRSMWDSDPIISGGGG
jgi:hypothetical protein